MTFNKRLLDIIACPVCKGKLVLHETAIDDNDEESSQASVKHELICRFDRLAFPIDEGIPVLLESESRAISLEELEQVKTHD